MRLVTKENACSLIIHLQGILRELTILIYSRSFKLADHIHENHLQQENNSRQLQSFLRGLFRLTDPNRVAIEQE